MFGEADANFIKCTRICNEFSCVMAFKTGGIKGISLDIIRLEIVGILMHKALSIVKTNTKIIKNYILMKEVVVKN